MGLFFSTVSLNSTDVNQGKLGCSTGETGGSMQSFPISLTEKSPDASGEFSAEEPGSMIQTQLSPVSSEEIQNQICGVVDGNVPVDKQRVIITTRSCQWTVELYLLGLFTVVTSVK